MRLVLWLWMGDDGEIRAVVVVVMRAGRDQCAVNGAAVVAA